MALLIMKPAVPVNVAAVKFVVMEHVKCVNIVGLIINFIVIIAVFLKLLLARMQEDVMKE